MTAPPPPQDRADRTANPAGERATDPCALDAEWQRIGHLVALVEAWRRGSPMPEGFAAAFEAVGETVRLRRADGAWAGLAPLVAASGPAPLVQFDVDLLALALAPEVWPALAPRMQALQPHLATPRPSLALVQEVLMLETGADVATLHARLAPTAPLIAAGLLRLEGEGPYQTLRATPAAHRAATGHPPLRPAPPGAHLETRRVDWDDLVLPPQTLRALGDFTAWLRRRAALADWGARPSGGPLALFSGPSGTGKSFAGCAIASALAAETGEPWALYTLDLGRVMSKYVGETEANMNALLDALDGMRAILQIDEADGLLGKRGEVTDARDRYANLEVSHLLSRIERHAGPVILTTNMRSNIDPAFLRRFQIVVDFPAPDATGREQLWARLLPPRAPRATDLDIAGLAAAVRLSGGAIQNAATYAAVLAAEAAAPIGPAHVARAVWAELGKDNRPVRRSEIGDLARHLEDASP